MSWGLRLRWLRWGGRGKDEVRKRRGISIHNFVNTEHKEPLITKPFSHKDIIFYHYNLMRFK